MNVIGSIIWNGMRSIMWRMKTKVIIKRSTMRSISERNSLNRCRSYWPNWTWPNWITFSNWFRIDWDNLRKLIYSDNSMQRYGGTIYMNLDHPKFSRNWSYPIPYLRVERSPREINPLWFRLNATPILNLQIDSRNIYLKILIFINEQVLSLNYQLNFFFISNANS